MCERLIFSPQKKVTYWDNIQQCYAYIHLNTDVEQGVASLLFGIIAVWKGNTMNFCCSVLKKIAKYKYLRIKLSQVWSYLIQIHNLDISGLEGKRQGSFHAAQSPTVKVSHINPSSLIDDISKDNLNHNGIIYRLISKLYIFKSWYKILYFF